MTTPKNSLRRRREALHLTQEELAHRVGATSKTIAKWEKGLSTVQMRYRARLGEALGLDDADLASLLDEITADYERRRTARDEEAAEKVRSAFARAPRTAPQRSPEGRRP